MYKILDAEQGSDEWFMDKLGVPSASVFSKIMTKTGKRSASSVDLINRLVAEKLLKIPDETFASDAMIRGSEMESDALDFLNFTTGLDLVPCGFIVSEKGYGGTPDAINEETKLVAEIKCPSLHTHLAYLASGKVPDKYMAQTQGQLLVTGFDEGVFCSYFPEFPSLIVKFKRDDKFLKMLEPILIEVCKEVEEKIKKLEGIVNQAPSS